MPPIFNILSYSLALALAQALDTGRLPNDASSSKWDSSQADITTHGSSAQTKSSGPFQPSLAQQAAIQASDVQFSAITLIALASFIAVLFIYRVTISTIRYIRVISCVGSTRQTYWSRPIEWYAFVKRYLIYSPLPKMNRQSGFQKAKGWILGALPSRLQSIFLVLLVSMNVALCIVGIDWSTTESGLMLLQLRHRTGTIAVVNMLPMIFLAGRNNPFIQLLNIPYASFSMVHRWLGRIIAIESVVHTSCYLANHVSSSGWKSVLQELAAFGQSAQTGLIALCGIIFIAAASVVIFRRAFYELWYHLHVVLVILSAVTLWYHLNTLSQQNYLRAFIMGWIIERSIRLFIMIYRNVGDISTEALVDYLPGDAVKVTLTLARPWDFQPGQHLFIAIPSIGLWTSHPFSLAWSDKPLSCISISGPIDLEKGINKDNKMVHTSVYSISSASSSSTYVPIVQPTMTAIIRRRAGFTQKLWARLRDTPDHRFRARAFVEGPYGGTNSLASYGTVLLFAGGVGITHQIAYLRALLEGHTEATVACQRLTLIWAVQSPEHLEWIRPWLSEILAMEGARQILRVQLHITRAYNANSLRSASTAVQMYLGRPNVDAIVEHETNGQIGAMAVSVCGPASLSNEVKRAVQERQYLRSIDLVEQDFEW